MYLTKLQLQKKLSNHVRIHLEIQIFLRHGFEVCILRKFTAFTTENL